MNKQELIEAVSDATGSTKPETSAVVDAIIATVTHELVQGRSVQLVGFGTFSTGERAGRTGRNPATGAEMHIAAFTRVKFSPGKAFKEEVNAT